MEELAKTIGEGVDALEELCVARYGTYNPELCWWTLQELLYRNLDKEAVRQLWETIRETATEEIDSILEELLENKSCEK